MLARWRILVSGRVQGVGLRYSCLRQAKKDQITGWVINLPNGQVEMEVQAEVEKLEKFVSWLKGGIRFFLVKVDLIQPIGTKHEKGFIIKFSD